MGAGQLDVKNLTISAGERVVLQGLSFSVGKGEVLFIKGPSGVGKSLLLRALAHLDRPVAGAVLLNGQTPSELGVPCWRARVMYVLQARVPLKGSPTEFYFQAQQLSSQRGRPRGDLPSLVHNMGLEQVVLNQPWSELSGGQAQRVMLAIATALRPDVLLLDEPTSACDPMSTRMVESTLRASGITTLWVSHDPEQPSRVGGRAMELPLGTITSLPPPPPQQSPSSPVHRSNGGAQQRPHEEEAHRVEVKVDSR